LIPGKAAANPLPGMDSKGGGCIGEKDNVPSVPNVAIAPLWCRMVSIYASKRRGRDDAHPYDT
jgi:hypothetical protein